MSTKIGINIAQRRKELGMTQEELAKRMDYKSKSTINKIELGINDIPQSKIVKFAEILNTSIAFLMGWEETPNEKNPPEMQLTEGEELLLDLFRKVPDDKKQMAIEMLKVALQVK